MDEEMIVFDECLDVLVGHIKRSSRIDLAVAFWGRGAGVRLGLSTNSKSSQSRPTTDTRKTRIICNLRMGGTNPDEIEKLLEQGISVRHDDQLHAKVYLFDTTAIVGSANASANGLGFEGFEAAWFEASAIVEDRHDLTRLTSWFATRWQKGRKVTQSDLDEARQSFQRARGRRALQKSNSQQYVSLIDCIQNNPDSFAGRVYIMCSAAAYGSVAKNYLDEIRNLSCPSCREKLVQRMSLRAFGRYDHKRDGALARNFGCFEDICARVLGYRWV